MKHQKEHEKEQVGYGRWSSKITPDLVAAKTLRFGLIRADGDDLYWSEYRPHEGRVAIVRLAQGRQPEDILPPQYSARSGVHEYGGGEFAVKGGRVVFVNSADQDLYLIKPETGHIKRLTNTPNMRYSDMAIDDAQHRLIAVAERPHMDHKTHHPQNLLISVALNDKDEPVNVLAEGHDFYAAPCISPEGTRLAWLAWDLPDMPWESAALYVADIRDDGSLSEPKHIAGGGGASIFQPCWGEDLKLYYVSDEKGYGDIWVREHDETLHRISSYKADVNRPLWSLGMRSYVFQGNGLIMASALLDGKASLCLIDNEADHHDTDLLPKLCSLESLAAIGNNLFGIGTTDFEAPAIMRIDQSLSIHCLRKSSSVPLCEDDISVGQKLFFENSRHQPVYGLYYPPKNRHFTGPEGEKPPLILMVHGGPTGAADRGLKLKIQYWTSRGVAVFDLDYSGSTGYGRAYRERLNGEWGILDVEDVDASVQYLVKNNLADPMRLAISGGSAGGFTVLSALARLNVFAVASCSYGVADLLHLQHSTHKFEAGYLFWLLGITPPQTGEDLDEEMFHRRSPVKMASHITAPVIFFQGLEDRVVPPEQTRRMADVLRSQKRAVKIFEFAGEGHGFRKIETVKTVLEEELKFFQEHLGL